MPENKAYRRLLTCVQVPTELDKRRCCWLHCEGSVCIFLSFCVLSTPVMVFFHARVAIQVRLLREGSCMELGLKPGCWCSIYRHQTALAKRGTSSVKIKFVLRHCVWVNDVLTNVFFSFYVVWFPAAMHMTVHCVSSAVCLVSRRHIEQNGIKSLIFASFLHPLAPHRPHSSFMWWCTNSVLLSF